MTTATAALEQPQPAEPADEETTTATPVVALKRRSIDTVLIGFGVVATAVFAVAGGLLTWGQTFPATTSPRSCRRRTSASRRLRSSPPRAATIWLTSAVSASTRATRRRPTPATSTGT